MSLAQEILDFLKEPAGLLQFVAICAPATALIMEFSLKSLIVWVEAKDWWPRAAPLQKALMMNFGYTEESLTPSQCASTYAYVIALCTHHFICGFMMLPVVVYGWAEAQTWGQALFVVAVMMDVSLDVYDEFRMFTLAFLYESVGKKIFGGEKCPKEFFIVMGVLHHPLAIMMACPFVLYHCSMASFHIIAVSLLLAAGICFTTGSYKFTLDMTKAFDWYQFKSIVVLQTVTILYTRGYIWFYHLYLILSTFWAEGDMNFFYSGCAAGTLMSLFNLVMIADAVEAAVKWLPRGRVTEGSSDHDELAEHLVSAVPPTPSKGTMKGSLQAAAAMGMAPDRVFRANVKAVMAAAKFKSLLTNKNAEEEEVEDQAIIMSP